MIVELNWVVVSNISYFYPYLGKIPNLTSIFSKGLKPPTSKDSGSQPGGKLFWISGILEKMCVCFKSMEIYSMKDL